MQRAWVALALVVGALAPRPALAQAAVEVPALAPDAGAPGTDGGPPDAGPVITPPALLRPSPAPYPPEAADAGLTGEVGLRLTLDAQGQVERAEVVQPAAPPLDDAALQAAMSLEFTPARVNGVPTPATLGYVYRFVPPPPPPPRAHALLAGELWVRGRNARAAGASVTARRPDAKEVAHAALSDGDGRFRLELEPGPWLIGVSAPGLARFEKREVLAPDQRLEVRYFVTPARGAYETVVVGARERVEVSRTDLRGDELREVPGTMGGDPFRAVLSLPGVAEPMSGVAYPIVRGAAPASTGWYLDGVHLPNLFHFFLLSAVVNPNFIEGIDFYPSAYPAEFGRFTGGIVNGHTATGRTDRTHGELSVDLINAGAFVETPLHLGDQTLSVAVGGRFSYLGVGLKVAEWLKLVDPGGYADYWDYQARVAWHPTRGRGTWRLFAFGSHDEAGSTESGQQQSALDSTFHRLDLRWQGPLLGAQVEAGTALGLDRLVGGDALEGDTWSVSPRMTAAWELGRTTLRAGGDAQLEQVHVYQRHGQGLDATDSGRYGPLDEDLQGGSGGLFAEAELHAGRFVVVPGLRAELYHAQDTTLPALEPRLAVRFALSEATTLKLGGGLYHQAPTAFVELPTVDLVGLSAGLQRSLNGAIGVEHTFQALGLEAEATFYWSEKLVLRQLDLDDPYAYTLRSDSARATANGLDLFRARRGRSIGLELMLRRKLATHLFGWIAYTFSRTTEWDPAFPASTPAAPIAFAPVYPDLFDQTHILNLVLSYQLPHRWRIGVGVHAHSGKPYDPHALRTFAGILEFDPPNATCGPPTATSGTTCWMPLTPRSARLPAFWRVDARLEKSWVHDRYTLTAYLDVLNASLQDEVIARTYTFDAEGTPEVQDTSIPLVVPMLGLRGDF